MSNKLTKEDVRHLAKLSNLQVTDGQIEKLTSQLDETLEYVKNLHELDTSKVSETHTSNQVNKDFEDGEECTRILTQEEALKNAKNKKNNYFVVKRIM